MSWLLLIFAGLGFTAAVAAYGTALKQREDPKTAADISLGIGNALFAGAGVAVLVFCLQQWVRSRLDETTARAEFLSRVNLSANLTGFDPPPTRRLTWDGHTCSSPDRLSSKEAEQLRGLAGWSFSAKNLEGARMNGLTLKSSVFKDARLVGVTFTCADLDGADLKRADLSGADLSGATLRGADLRGADLDGSIWDVQDWAGAKVDISTCWPVVGPWVSTPADRWMEQRGLAPRILGNRPAAYGHFCDERRARTVIFTDGIRPARDVPPAIGRTNDYLERRWRSDVLAALRKLVRLQRDPAARGPA